MRNTLSNGIGSATLRVLILIVAGLGACYALGRPFHDGLPGDSSSYASTPQPVNTSWDPPDAPIGVAKQGVVTVVLFADPTAGNFDAAATQLTNWAKSAAPAVRPMAIATGRGAKPLTATYDIPGTRLVTPWTQGELPCLVVTDKWGHIFYRQAGDSISDETKVIVHCLAVEDEEKVVKSDAEWRQILPSNAYNILRQSGTEEAFTGAYWNNERQGIYVCAACGQPLFSSDTKFDSGTGWPSFYTPLSPGAVDQLSDTSLGMDRTEIRCSRCGSHLGHVFDDGPQPTGLRYCMNSAALKFIPAK